VEFSLPSGSKVATNVNLIERNRIRGWIAIIREGKGFIEQSNTKNNIEPVVFTISSFTGDNTQIELGDEVEFSLRKVSTRLIAENILKLPSTVNTLYVSVL
jgi:cold shock CspA family protein